MAITPTTGESASNAVAGTTLAAAAFVATAGQSIIVAVALANTATSVSGIADTAGNTYALQAAITNGATVRTELWAATNITGNAANVVTVTVGSASLMAFALEEYAGAVSTYIGRTSTTSGTGFSPVTSLTTQDGGNFTVAALGFVCNSGDTLTAFEGTIGQSVIPALTSVGVALVGANSAGIGIMPAGCNISASRDWAAAALELRTHVAAPSYVGYVGPIPFPFDPVAHAFIVNIGLNTYIMPLREAASLSGNNFSSFA